ncbi:protein prickle-like [Tetranychus urticae]|uniref:LIM zinc-binding domain-containing protein n=1 Tax=Tetranychus urticae TaxID=32264 RepID=T1JX69_TETUR|nr:protein prickle-like [Tetranychus urticae]
MDAKSDKFGTNQLYGAQSFRDDTPSRFNHNYQQVQQLNHGNNQQHVNTLPPKDGSVPRWLPKCGYCDKLILEEQCTEAEEKVWHLKCFKCFDCKKTLGGQQYVMARPTVLRSNETTFNPENEYPYCLSCFDANYAELCEECGDIIGCEIGSIKHENRHWHANETCFKCNFCKTALLGKLFLPANDGKIYCSARCYQYILEMYHPPSIRERVKLPPPPPPPPSTPPLPPPYPHPHKAPISPSLQPSSSTQLPVSLPTQHSTPSPSAQPSSQETQATQVSTVPVPQDNTVIPSTQSTTPNIKPHPSSSENSLVSSRSSLINDKPDVIQNYLNAPDVEKVAKELAVISVSEEKKPDEEISPISVKVIENTQKLNPKSVTFDPSVKENESSRKCRSNRKSMKEDDCCSTCSSHSSSSSDDDFDYDLMDARRRQWIAGTRVHYVAATAQPVLTSSSSSSTSTLPKTKNLSKINDSKTKVLHKPIKRFQDCSMNWAEILRSKLKGR